MRKMIELSMNSKSLRKMESVDFTGCEKKEAIRSLWENSTVARFFTLSGISSPALTDDELNEAVSSDYIDYLAGRVMKMNMESYPVVDPWGYDRDNGTGSMAKVAKQCRTTK